MSTKGAQSLSTYLTGARGGAVPLHPVRADELDGWCKGLPAETAQWVRSNGFEAGDGDILALPDARGGLGGVALGLGEGDTLWSLAGLPGKLPAGRYALAADWRGWAATRAALGWALGSYRFTRYRERQGAQAVLAWPRGSDRGYVSRAATAVALVRDLITTPSADMGPADLAAAAKALARRHGARLRVIEGEQLLRRNYPAIHAVGRASPRAPRLLDLTWGRPSAPRVTVVGKGVCFDSGGLDLKPSSAMRLMKKDMGGAAVALGLAHMVMAAGLKVRLRVLVPAVENSVSGNAYRPGDVIATRKGLTVEVGNTDAEGRLVLADALVEADREAPALLVDFATLTGAARVALGPDLPALFTPDDALAADLLLAGETVEDPLWRLPLWQPYAKDLESPVADLANVSEGSFAGAVTAALFLSRFVTATKSYAHVDLYGWNQRTRPGRPLGGEAMALRAVYHVIAQRFSGRASALDGRPAAKF